MCSASPDIRHLRANLPVDLRTDDDFTRKVLDPLAEHKARMEREHQATLRRNQRGLWILAAIVAVIVLKLAGVLP